MSERCPNCGLQAVVDDREEKACLLCAYIVRPAVNPVGSGVWGGTAVGMRGADRGRHFRDEKNDPEGQP